MKKPFWKNPLVVSLTALLLTILVLGTVGVFVVAHALIPHRTDRPMTADESATVQSALSLIRARGLTLDADTGAQITRRNVWRAATPSDPYLHRAEQMGDTPFAYTLSSGHVPSAIVLAPRFFTETTPTARAALLVHEMAHYRAYVLTGRSDEFDGYKREYDTHAQLGLGEQDSLTYFSMLDGVVEYVVPRLPVYKSYPDVKAYINQSGTS